jgi:molybdopterin converting factor small subunit
MAHFKSNNPGSSFREKLFVATHRKGLSVKEREALAEELSALIDALEQDLSALVQKELEALLDVIHGCPSEEELLRAASIIH